MLFFQDFAIQTVKSTHEFWKALISKKTDAGELNWWATFMFKVHLLPHGADSELFTLINSTA